MMKLCSHYKSLKVEKIANFIKDYKPRCQNQNKHISEKENLWQCLSCVFVGCGRSNKQQCANKHSYYQSHNMAICLNTAELFCYKCDQSLQQQIDLANGMEMESKDLDFLVEFAGKCERYCQAEQKRADQKGFKNVIENYQPNSLKITQKSQNNHKSMESEEQSDDHVQSKKSSVKLNVFGLNNLGNTCFYNSILQCLYATQLLHETYPLIDFSRTTQDRTASNLVKQSYFTIKTNEKLTYNKPKNIPTFNINKRFQSFLSMGSQSKNCVHPSDLFEAVGNVKSRFRSMNQQDAQELLRCLLDALNQGEITYLDINREYLQGIQLTGKRMKLTTIQNIFGSFLASRLHCLNCNKVSWTMDLSLDLNIELTSGRLTEIQLPSNEPIPENEVHASGLYYPSKDIKIPPMLEHFFSAEPLSKLNYFNCEHCKASKATKKLYIKDPPRNLTVVLKRFTNAGQKNNADIPFPMTLDISGVCINPGKWVYNLYGISVHQGSARGGHYIAYTRRDQSWYYFSDSSWKQVSLSSVKGAQAYILFYDLA